MCDVRRRGGLEWREVEGRGFAVWKWREERIGWMKCLGGCSLDYCETAWEMIEDLGMPLYQFWNYSIF